MGAALVSLAMFATVVGVVLELIVKAEVEKNKLPAEQRRMFSVEWDEHLWTETVTVTCSPRKLLQAAGSSASFCNSERRLRQIRSTTLLKGYQGIAQGF